MCVEESAQWLTTLLVPQSDNGYASIKLATQPIPQEAEKNPPPPKMLCKLQNSKQKVVSLRSKEVCYLDWAISQPEWVLPLVSSHTVFFSLSVSSVYKLSVVILFVFVFLVFCLFVLFVFFLSELILCPHLLWFVKHLLFPSEIWFSSYKQ